MSVTRTLSWVKPASASCRLVFDPTINSASTVTDVAPGCPVTVIFPFSASRRILLWPATGTFSETCPSTMKLALSGQNHGHVPVLVLMVKLGPPPPPQAVNKASATAIPAASIFRVLAFMRISPSSRQAGLVGLSASCTRIIRTTPEGAPGPGSGPAP